ncbi:hypothetical protein [Mitsuaria sp. GD03876]|uniref:hypothetical protein n=1 Tax=Mitsuaria sp. GD03876 TaxID=2975399 RepID=UPI002446AA90|nr:hypothetical protein [Mitsuaria sp. GD03876]MDH0863643.1 hypothetical protein [Mitsuaria sp. GD03876]
MEFLKIFDAYSIRARLFPAIIASAPAMAALALLISWKSFGLSNAIATIGILVLLFAIADFARTRGGAIEKNLFAKHGGMPSITLFRHSDTTIDAGSKARYRSFLAEQLNTPFPTPEEEAKNPEAGDAVYEQAGVWIRHNTRDVKKFSLLFSENVAYGFRRNLLGLKWIGLALNLVVVAASVLLLSKDGWAFDTSYAQRILVVLVVACFHAMYMLVAVREAAVWDGAMAYGRQLILSCEAFISGKSPPAKKRAPARKRTAKSVDADPTKAE